MSVNEKMTAIAAAIRDKTGKADALTLDDMAADIPKVYDAGRQSSYDEFWDNYQQNGNLKNYKCVFAGRAWNNNTFKPKYDIQPTNATYIFQESLNLTNIKDCGVNIDLSKATTLNGAFYYSAVTELGEVSTVSASSLADLFAYCYNLVSIDKLILKPVGGQTFTSGTFASCNALEKLIVSGVISTNNFNVKAATKLNCESILSIILCLSDTTTGLTVTLPTTAKETYYNNSGASVNYDTADEAWAALITDKPNWTIALA
jgi:hypothetical protein